MGKCFGILCRTGKVRNHFNTKKHQQILKKQKRLQGRAGKMQKFRQYDLDILQSYETIIPSQIPERDGEGEQKKHK